MGNTFKTGNYVNGIFQDTSNNIGIGAAPSGTYKFEITGTSKVSGVLTLGSTLSNGTYTYTLPAATGTLALVGGAGVGTVTSVAALTLGTTGTDLSSTVATSTTTPVITLNVPTASAANRGALSSADWTTFNNKQGTITLTTTGTSGAATFTSNTLNIPNYAPDLSGYVTLATTQTITGAKTFNTGITINGVSVLDNIQIGTTSAFLSNNVNAMIAWASSFSGYTNGTLILQSRSSAATPIVFATGTTTATVALTLASTGAATFSSSIIFANNSSALCYGSSSSRFFVYNGINTYIGDIDSYAPSASLILRVNGSDRLTIIASTGAATFSSSVTAGGQVSINAGNGNQLYLNNSGQRYTQITFDYNSSGSTKGGLWWDNNESTFNMYAATSSHLALWAGATERMRITSGGNVGIGTTSPSTTLDITSSGSQGGLRVRNTTANIPTITLGVTDVANSDFNIQNRSGNLSIVGGTTGGNVLIDTTTDDTVNKLQVNGTVATNGIKFPATQVASANANTLDDYEEGTFTAVVVGSTTAGTATYADQNGRYTKIGNVVYFRIDLVWTVHTGTGQITITGLPFSGAQQYMSTGMVRFNQTITALNYLGGHYFFNSTMYIEQMPVGGGSPSGVLITSSGDMRISGFIIT